MPREFHAIARTNISLEIWPISSHLVSAELVFQMPCHAKLESFSCTCESTIVEDGHIHLHWNAPSHYRPFQLRFETPCDWVWVLFICECDTAIFIKGQFQPRFLEASWVRKLFPVKWNSAQVLQCPREGVRLGTTAVLCSMCLLMFPICHALGCERNGLCGCKSHCWHTFPQGDSSTGPQCGPKQHVIGWVCRAKPKLCEHEMLRVYLWCDCQGNPWQEESAQNPSSSIFFYSRLFYHNLF